MKRGFRFPFAARDAFGGETVLGIALAVFACSTFAAPFVPQDETRVLETVRPPSANEGARTAREFLAKLRANPTNLVMALEVAHHFIKRSRSEADPRYLGYAEAALQPWWSLNSPPAGVLIARATIRQSNHDFANALADLDLALKMEATNAQAWLTRATILQVQGRFDEAKRACLPLVRLSSELISVTCASSIASLNGEAEKSFSLLHRVLDRAADAPAEERVWALTVLAEIAERRGDFKEAEQSFRVALALNPNDPYLLSAYGDFLLDRQRAKEVIDLLRQRTRIDGLLLRLVLAEIASGGVDAEAHATILQQRFQANRQSSESVHQREESRFALHVLRKSAEALKLAQENWRVQREPADARILLEAALAERNRNAGEAVLMWLRETRLEDVRLARLASRANLELGEPIVINSSARQASSR